MRIHILGICGTFMSGLAIIARQQGHEVSGSDEAIYPPMSTQLKQQGIELIEGYSAEALTPMPDCVVIGNAMSRGNPAVEYTLNERGCYQSGPQWLAEQVLVDKHVLAVAGTHGKTTTASMLAWILEAAGYNPGFLIGGIPQNFGVSARYTHSPYFVLEADEYDSAFFDKRSKFLHFQSQTLILNSLEFDHADIFEDLAAIKKQFQFLLRTVPANGSIIAAGNDKNIEEVIARGCWTPVQTYAGSNANWQAETLRTDSSEFLIYFNKKRLGKVEWELLGEHNVHNALAAIAAACQIGIEANQAIESLSNFQGVKRRLELRGQVNGITVYDDFAHHPTAIATTLAGLRAKIGDAKIIVVAEFASYTMRAGFHKKALPAALKEADQLVFLQPELNWDMQELLAQLSMPATVYADVSTIVEVLVQQAKPGDFVLIMSNRGFGDIHEKLLKALHTA